MTHASAQHRHLDHQAAHALGAAPRHAPLPSRLREKDMRTMSASRILLTTLSVRTSAKGRPYLSGFLGKSRVVALEGEADRFGNPTWDMFVAKPEPHAAPPAARQRVPGSAAASASPETPAGAGAHPGGPYRAALRPQHDGDCHG